MFELCLTLVANRVVVIINSNLYQPLKQGYHKDDKDRRIVVSMVVTISSSQEL